jgi:hypothetical protein
VDGRQGPKSALDLDAPAMLALSTMGLLSGHRPPTAKELTARFGGTCLRCQREIRRGDPIVFFGSGSVFCLGCGRGMVGVKPRRPVVERRRDGTE